MLDQTTKPIAWSATDFVVIVLAGLAGAFLLGGVGLIAGLDETGLLLLSTLGMAGAQILAVGLVLRQRGHTFGDMGLVTKPSDGAYLGLGLILQIALATLALPFLELVAPDGGPSQVVVEQVSSVTALGARVGVFLLVGLIGPLAEELVFRGTLLQLVSRRFGRVGANVATAGLFSLVHLIGLDTQNLWIAAITLTLLFLLGLVLGALTQRHGRLGPAIFTHAGYNTTTLLLLYAAPQLAG